MCLRRGARGRGGVCVVWCGVCGVCPDLNAPRVGERERKRERERERERELEVISSDRAHIHTDIHH